MTIRKLASDIAKIEGKKSQARIGDIREILSILADMYIAIPNDHVSGPNDPFQVLYELGISRARRRKKAKP